MDSTIKTLFLLLFSVALFAGEPPKTPLPLLLDVTTSPAKQPLTLGSLLSHRVIVNDPLSDGRFDTAVSQLQQRLRHTLNHSPDTALFLYAKGTAALIAAIAQTNLHPTYRQRIKGLILHDVTGDLNKRCDRFRSLHQEDDTCQAIRLFAGHLAGQASKTEIAAALSPARQVDWHWPPVLLMGHAPTDRDLSDALDANDITSFTGDFSDVTHFIARHQCRKRSGYDYPFKRAPLLRFHLGKILYEPHDPIQSRINIKYANDPHQRYDLFYRADGTSKPLFIYVHGGGWTLGDKQTFRTFCTMMADNGYSAIAINYRLLKLPNVGMKQIVLDVKNALRHIILHAKDYEADPHRIAVMAESAGAQLAFMAMTWLEPSERKRIKAAIFNSITADLTLHPKAKQIRLSGRKDDASRGKWLYRYSPVNYLGTMRVNALFLHSIDDHGVHAEHLVRLERKAEAKKRPVRSIWITGGSHPITPLNASLQPGFANLETQIGDFLHAHLKK